MKQCNYTNCSFVCDCFKNIILFYFICISFRFHSILFYFIYFYSRRRILFRTTNTTIKQNITNPPTIVRHPKQWVHKNVIGRGERQSLITNKKHAVVWFQKTKSPKKHQNPRWHSTQRRSFDLRVLKMSKLAKHENPIGTKKHKIVPMGTENICVRYWTQNP